MSLNDERVRYEMKTVHSIRGLEGKTRSKMEQDGWELVQQNQGALRSRLVFRRPKKTLPRTTLIVSGSVVAVAVIGTTIGAITEGDPAPVETATAIARPEASASAADFAVASPSATASSATASTEAAAASAAADAPSVTDAEVLQVFDDYFAQRSSKGVVLAKAVSEVRFESGTVRVTFDPAKAGITKDQFDYINPFPNLASFVASPIAFNDEVGNLIRPSVESITTVASDGTSLGSLTHDQILALNELDR
jgi:hypothetical protein